MIWFVDYHGKGNGMEPEKMQTQETTAAGDTALDAGEQEDFEALIRGKYKEDFDARVQKILDGRLRGMRRENQALRQQQQRRQEETAQRLRSLQEQEDEVRRLYPSYRWQEELQNPRFGQLVLAGVDPTAAYEAVHHRELLEQAMRYAATRTRRQVAGSLAGQRLRPAENGGRSVAVTGSDPRGLTSEELADIRRRVLDGEKIRF